MAPLHVYLRCLIMEWRAVKAPQVLRALIHIGWRIKRQRGSHRILEKSGHKDITFAFHDGEEIGPHMLARIAKYSGLRPEDL